RVLLSTGLRVSELVNLKVRDVHFDDLGAVLEVRRKGNRMDLVYLGRENAEVLKRYMSIRSENVKSSEYLFVSRTGKRIDRSMIYRIVKEFFKLSGLRKKKMGPHVLRHTFATMLMRKNVSIYKIKELLNHKRITTTERYLHLVEDDLRKTLEEVGL
ncbi:MAG: tyrosine-type recombinase/integrase, partial [Thermotogae bacterium]|nr:tyrosine-type recombinase/integrase [Thermotogota bacterium]